MMVSKPERVPKPTHRKVTAVTGGTGPALTIGSELSTASMSSGISSGHTSSTSRRTPPTTTSVSTVMAAPESGMTKSLSTGSGTDQRRHLRPRLDQRAGAHRHADHLLDRHRCHPHLVHARPQAAVDGQVCT